MSWPNLKTPSLSYERLLCATLFFFFLNEKLYRRRLLVMTKLCFEVVSCDLCFKNTELVNQNLLHYGSWYSLYLMFHEFYIFHVLILCFLAWQLWGKERRFWRMVPLCPFYCIGKERDIHVFEIAELLGFKLRGYFSEVLIFVIY